ncbi:hypothetical protein [Ferrimonas marina]|uniref:Uncharacterized protein n=1 Tax=Ferrimonas marina TaxID=299255 RepID=A0A1M5MML3_9GAMM|nr:hypothetical protein [Ferrimonas marina]SHG78282.1 hypothetical protein SAMN02745129_0694 [Ferrimonas marina]
MLEMTLEQYVDHRRCQEAQDDSLLQTHLKNPEAITKPRWADEPIGFTIIAEDGSENYDPNERQDPLHIRYALSPCLRSANRC